MLEVDVYDPERDSEEAEEAACTTFDSTGENCHLAMLNAEHR